MTALQTLPATGRTGISRKLKVMHLISSAGIYGAEKMLISLARGLNQFDCECVVGVIDNQHGPGDQMTALARAEGLEVRTIPCGGKLDVKACRELARHLSSDDIDILHAHGYKADLYAYAATRRRPTALVATSHLWTLRTPMLRAWAVLDQFALRRFDHVVAVSEQLAHSLRSTRNHHLAVSTIDNGVDIGRFSQTRPALREEFNLGENIVIGTVARLVEQKGLEYFLRSARLVADVYPRATFVIVGEGPLHEQLVQLTASLGIEKQVIFAGKRTDMANVYSSLDIFVLASIDEGMPIALLEALASRLPVVATSVASVPKLVLDNRTGILVTPRDIPGLAAAMCRLIADKPLRDQLAASGSEHVRLHYSADAMAREYLSVYNRVMQRRKQSHELCAVSG